MRLIREAQIEPGEQPEDDAGGPEALEVVEQRVQQPGDQAGKDGRVPGPVRGSLSASHALAGGLHQAHE
jgi:hypothetical protein